MDLLNVALLGRGFAWLDTGTHKTLFQAGQYVQTIEENQGIKIACLEEIAYRMGFLTKEQVVKYSENYAKNEYFEYVRELSSSNQPMILFFCCFRYHKRLILSSFL